MCYRLKWTILSLWGKPKKNCLHAVAAFVAGIVRDAFSLWLNAHLIKGFNCRLAINTAQSLKTAKKVTRKRVTSGPALPGKSPTAHRPT